MGTSCYLNVNVKKADILDIAILTSDKLLKNISVFCQEEGKLSLE